MPCAIGKNGVTAPKREGDGCTPAGAFRLVGLLNRPDRVLIGSAAPLRHMMVWSDDPSDPGYNALHRGRSRPFGHEMLWRADPLYDLIGVLDYNLSPAHPGLGSAIFLHSWRRPRFPTEGCVALRRKDLTWVLARWTRRSRIVIL